MCILGTLKQMTSQDSSVSCLDDKREKRCCHSTPEDKLRAVRLMKIHLVMAGSK